MDKQLKRILIAIAFGAVLFVGLSNFSKILDFLKNIGSIFQPVIIGGIIAFILNVPVKKFSGLFEKLERKLGKELKPGLNRVLSILLTILCILAVISIVSVILVPQLVSSAKTAASALKYNLPRLLEFLQQHGIDSEWLDNMFSTLENMDIFTIVKNSLTGVASTLISTLSSTLGTAFNVIMAIILSIYMLMCKETLLRQTKKLMAAYLPERAQNALYKVGNLINDTYSDFLCGQCLEAVILGCLMFIAFAIFRLPYAGLVAVLTAVLSFVPYIGSFLSCALGALLILMTSPVKALISVIVYQVVQFCENQFIYPRVVGGSVGLPALWTLIAVLIGGNLFGVAGIIFFIPVVSVIFKIVSELVNNRLGKHSDDDTGAD